MPEGWPKARKVAAEGTQVAEHHITSMTTPFPFHCRHDSWPFCYTTAKKSIASPNSRLWRLNDFSLQNPAPPSPQADIAVSDITFIPKHVLRSYGLLPQVWHSEPAPYLFPTSAPQLQHRLFIRPQQLSGVRNRISLMCILQVMHVKHVR
jgi:hypothetical protein